MSKAVRQILDMNAYDDATDTASPATARRLGNFGAASVLFYRDPIEMVSAKGCWMTARDGTRYLDFYNNVPSVGHCHPTVVRAVSDQIARLNIHSRYVVDVVDQYLEALKALLPQTLNNVMMTCSGSEANDLALRIAQKVTGGRGVVVTETAYHGSTAAVTEISPSALKSSGLPEYVVAVPPPSPEYYGNDVTAGFATAVSGAVATLQRRGIAPAALICDTIFSSDGVYPDPPGALKPAVAAIREAGGMFIADEVQPGFARTGAAFWGYQRHGITPDLLTMGKPMGNGFPMAAVATSAEHLVSFCEDVGYFNTFGGNPVAAAAGLAVLKVIDEEALQENAASVGRALVLALRELAGRQARLGAVRGAGLFIGIDIVVPDGSGRPDPNATSDVINALKTRQILIGAAGKYGATLKVRPPLCLSRDEAQTFTERLDAVLRELG
ncbi:MAG: aminotransferase class III-fold pyridoxal phosphate-dependent enzyme [Pseudomonadota bacterium]